MKNTNQVLIGFLSLIIGIPAMIEAILYMSDWCQKHKKIEPVVSYLSEYDENISNLYPLFDDYIKPDYEQNVFLENCATQIMITNHYDTEICIDKIILEAKEINIDYRPVLQFCYGYKDVNGLNLIIKNNGWGDAKGLKVKTVDKENNLSDYFNENALEFEVPLIEAGSSIEVPFIKYSDFLMNEIEDRTFSVGFDVECESNDDLIVYGEYIFSITDGRLEYPAIGGSSQNAYGIGVDTDNENFKWEKEILELIGVGEMLVIPVCFYPDKSCTMHFQIFFEIVKDGNKMIIETPLTEVSFLVSSIPYAYYKKNNSINDDIKSDSLEILAEPPIISYPSNSSTIVGI